MAIVTTRADIVASGSSALYASVLADPLLFVDREKNIVDDAADEFYQVVASGAGYSLRAIGTDEGDGSNIFSGDMDLSLIHI